MIIKKAEFEVAYLTITCIASVFVKPAVSLTVNRKVSAVLPGRFTGAVNVALAVLALFSRTAGPPVCVHA
jgi:hypothetical protein